MVGIVDVADDEVELLRCAAARARRRRLRCLDDVSKPISLAAGRAGRGAWSGSRRRQEARSARRPAERSARRAIGAGAAGGRPGARRLGSASPWLGSSLQQAVLGVAVHDDDADAPVHRAGSARRRRTALLEARPWTSSMRSSGRPPATSLAPRRVGAVGSRAPSCCSRARRR